MSQHLREYEKTHPWIEFNFNAEKLDLRIWHLLGQIEAQCEHISGVPVLPEVQRDLLQMYLAKGARATVAIEGNTLTEDEALQAVNGDLKLPPSKEYLKQEIENIIDALKEIVPALVSGESQELRPENIQMYNSLILRNLELREEVIPGKYRRHDVIVAGTGYKGVPVEDISILVGQLCEWLNGWDIGEFPTAVGILKAIIAHVYLAWIHPFGDGNGRTARLVELQILLTSGLPLPTAHLLSNHYNQTRSEYYRFLDITSEREHGLFHFIAYALQGFFDGLTEQIALIEEQQLKVHWAYYIHENFRNKDGKTQIRRRKLMLDISDKPNPVPLSEIRHVSPRIAEAYATLNDRTVKRDVNALAKMELLIETPEGHLLPNWGIMLAFIPPRRDDPQD